MAFATTAAVVGVASLGLGAYSMYSQSQAAGIQAKNQRNITHANKEMRQAETERLNAESGVARYMQTLNNSRRMKQADSAVQAAHSNLVRQLDQWTRGDVEAQIQSAEALGAYAARAASLGIGGASVDVVAQTMRLQQSRKQAVSDANKGYMTYDAVNQIAGIVPDAAASLDMSVINGSQDVSVDLQSVNQGYDWAGALASSGVLKGVANLFSGMNVGNAGTGLNSASTAFNTLKAPTSGFWSTSGSGSTAGVSYSLI